LEERAPQRERPALADQAHVGERLFHHHAALGAFDDEDEVEVAVADLAHPPVGRLAAEAGGDRRQARQISSDVVFLQGAIAGRDVEGHDAQLFGLAARPVKPAVLRCAREGETIMRLLLSAAVATLLAGCTPPPQSATPSLPADA